MSEMPKWREIHGYWEMGDAKYYGRWIESLPDGATLVEVGSFRGKSLCSVAEILKRKKIRVWSLDIWGTRSYDEPDVEKHRAGMLNDFVKNVTEYGLDPVTICVMGKDSLSYIASLIEPDMVFIDGDHTREGVKLDLDTWVPRVKVGGVIAGHDYGPQWDGVWHNVGERFGHENITHKENMDDPWDGFVWGLRKTEGMK